MGSIPVRSPQDLEKVGKYNTDLIELRLDYLHSLDGFDLHMLSGIKERLIITVRDPKEGGVNPFKDDVKITFLKRVVKESFLVDVESEFAERNNFDCRNQIVSRHYLHTDPSYEELNEFAHRYRGESKITKIALRFGESSLRKLVRLLSESDNLAVMEADGEASSRLLYSVLGSKLLYCHLGEKTSPGQLGCEEAKSIMDLIKNNKKL